MKHLTALFLCGALLLSPVLAAEGAPVFSDVDPEDYFGMWNSQGERILGILDVKEYSLSKEGGVLWVTLEEPAEDDTMHLRVGFPGDTIRDF